MSAVSCCNRDLTCGLKVQAELPRNRALAASSCGELTCGPEVEPESSSDQELSRDTDHPAHNVQETSRCLQLPAEIRVRIYTYLFHDPEAKTLICTWPSVIQPSHTTSLVSPYGAIHPNYTWSLDKPCRLVINASDIHRTAMLQTSKFVHVEATSVFYAIHHIRFNSEQMGILRQKTNLLNSLVNIQIENTVSLESFEPQCGQLVDTLSELSSGWRMRNVAVGMSFLTNALRTPWLSDKSESGLDTRTRKTEKQIVAFVASTLDDPFRRCITAMRMQILPKVVFIDFIYYNSVRNRVAVSQHELKNIMQRSQFGRDDSGVKR